MLQCNLTELLQLALCKGETSLDAAFIDAGFTFNKHDRKLQGEQHCFVTTAYLCWSFSHAPQIAASTLLIYVCGVCMLIA